MDVLGPVLSAAGRLVGHDANKYCDQFNVTYEHRVDDPGALLDPRYPKPCPCPGSTHATWPYRMRCSGLSRGVLFAKSVQSVPSQLLTTIQVHQCPDQSTLIRALVFLPFNESMIVRPRQTATNGVHRIYRIRLAFT